MQSIERASRAWTEGWFAAHGVGSLPDVSAALQRQLKVRRGLPRSSQSYSGREVSTKLKIKRQWLPLRTSGLRRTWRGGKCNKTSVEQIGSIMKYPMHSHVILKHRGFRTLLAAVMSGNFSDSDISALRLEMAWHGIALSGTVCEHYPRVRQKFYSCYIDEALSASATTSRSHTFPIISAFASSHVIHIFPQWYHSLRTSWTIDMWSPHNTYICRQQ